MTEQHEEMKDRMMKLASKTPACRENVVRGMTDDYVRHCCVNLGIKLGNGVFAKECRRVALLEKLYQMNDLVYA